MSLRTRFSCLTLGILLLAGILGTELAGTPAGFTPFVPTVFPQRALGDFDGDGRSDTAFIQQDAAGSFVTVTLSGSPGVTVTLSGSPALAHLGSTVVSLITTDIDHDGDLDLIAAVPPGEVVAWINDGHGHFTQQAASHSDGLSAEAVMAAALHDGPPALASVKAPLVAPRTPNGDAVLAFRIRPPTVPPRFTLACVLLPSLRGPPPSLCRT